MRAQTEGRTPILDYRRDENRTFNAKECTVLRVCGNFAVHPLPTPNASAPPNYQV